MRFVVIMAGGGGTRLWPASRKSKPKQLLPLGPGGETLLGATRRRLAGLVPPERTWVVTASSLIDGCAAALPEVPRENLLGEPVGRNTAAALGLAAVYLSARDPAAVMACLPADQHIADEAELARVCERAFAHAEKTDAIVTVGLEPTRAEIGFGYLELADEVAPGVRAVARFVEKPDLPTAERYRRSGKHLWNGGMFFVSARRLLAEIATHLPALSKGLGKIASALAEGGPVAAGELVQKVYPDLPSISIDHGVMEKAEGICTVRGDFGWNDVGAWSALAEVVAPDAQGNHVRGTTLLAHDATGNIVVSDPGTVVALVGVKDLVVVRAGDAVLVLPRDRAQDVKEIHRLLEERGLKGSL